MIFSLVDKFKVLFRNVKIVRDVNDSPLSTFDLITMIISYISIILFFIEYFVKISDEQKTILYIVDNIICGIFFIDYLIDYFESKDKVQYLKRSWLDLLACVPAINILGFDRVTRFFRIFRLFKAISSTKALLLHSVRSKSDSILTMAFVIGIMVIIFSSISILYFETDPNSNIKTTEDAIWWTFTTITTVGYGDRFPVTTEGRMVGVLTMVVGISVFSIVTAYISSKFSNFNLINNETKNN